MDFFRQLELWHQKASDDIDLIDELNSIKNNQDEIADRFFKELEFGTGGLRGVIGAGSNRVNIYTIGKATQGICDYLTANFKNPSVCIAYDSRIKSDLFAKRAAEVFSANGVRVYLYSELMPTPMLSYAVRKLKCDAGVVVTASHNPAKYNGYKVYGSDGCQLTLEASEVVIGHINIIDCFDDVKAVSFEKALVDGMISYISEDVIDCYLDEVSKQSINSNVFNGSDLKVIYTPLHGSGNKPVRRILSKMGLSDVEIVKEQEFPDGNFPTAPFPNPEIRQVFECALHMAEKSKPDLLLATDPDCDRVGIAVLHNGEYVMMSGNEVGILLLDYILKERKNKGTLPECPAAIKTIVTTNLAKKICEKYNCQLFDLLTGFKFIGEQIVFFEKDGEENRFVFGFEESYGYLAGSYVRDKDAVVGSMLICEMTAFYKKQNKTLPERMKELYDEHGYYINLQLNYEYEGMAGMQKIVQIMQKLLNNPPLSFDGKDVTDIIDYEASESLCIKTGVKTKITLPRSQVLHFIMDGAEVIVRPSGTEPKIKAYVETNADTFEKAQECAAAIEKEIMKFME